MGKLREEITQLAQNLAQDAKRRREFVARNKKETAALLNRFTREQEHRARDIAAQARSVSTMLVSARSAIRSGVAKTLSDSRSRRVRNAQEQSSARRQVVTRIRREVAYSLDRHRNERARNARHQLRMSNLAMQTVRRRVADVRNQSNRLTSKVASELNAGRQSLAMARQSVATGFVAPITTSDFLSTAPTTSSTLG